MVAEASYDDPYFSELHREQKQACAAFLHYPETRPDFLSWSVNDLPMRRRSCCASFEACR